MTVHSFARSLERSAKESDNPIWETVYRKAFPSLASVVCVREDGWAQRGGIDRLLVLASGKTLSVDEKVRERDYGDVLLEYWSNYERRVPGWIAKDLACDFIAYAVLPTKKCYLLPFQTLRQAWRNNRNEWVNDFREVKADNGTYTTVSVAVPVGVLFDSLRDAMTVRWAEK
jgi:hypothetical protein